MLTRRRLLRGGLGWVTAGVAATLTVGCAAPDPGIDPGSALSSQSPKPAGTPTSSLRSPSATPTASPTSVAPRPAEPKQTAALKGEQALVALASAILAGPHRGQLKGPQRQLLTAVRDGHRVHAAALSSATPTARPAPTSAGPAGRLPPGATSLAASLRLLAAEERRQSARLAKAARTTVGYGALLLGSMSVAAQAYAEAATGNPAGVAAPSARPHTAMPPMSDVAAVQAVVRQLHALVYGYQLALGRLSVLTPRGRQAQRALAARRQLRDRLVQVLVARGADVPAAEAAYVPAVQPTSARRSARLIRQMEAAFLPYCGVWLASAGQPGDRRLALETLTATANTARSWGAATGPWPGWRD